MKTQRIKTYGIFLGDTGGETCHILQDRFKKKITGCLITDEISGSSNILTSLKEINLVSLKRDFEGELKRKITEKNPVYLVCKLDDFPAAVALPRIIPMLKEKKIRVHCFCIYPEKWEGKQKIKIAKGLIRKLKTNQISYSIIAPEKWMNEERDKNLTLQVHLDFIPLFTANVINIYNILIQHLSPLRQNRNDIMLTINQMMQEIIDDVIFAD